MPSPARIVERIFAMILDRETGGFRESGVLTAGEDRHTGLTAEEQPADQAENGKRQDHTGRKYDISDLEGKEIRNDLIRFKAVHLDRLTESVSEHPSHFTV